MLGLERVILAPRNWPFASKTAPTCVEPALMSFGAPTTTRRVLQETVTIIRPAESNVVIVRPCPPRSCTTVFPVSGLVHVIWPLTHVTDGTLRRSRKITFA